MGITSTELKQFAIENGAELVGIASVDQFILAPAGHRPEDLLPGAKTVVVCAMRLMRGALDSPFTLYHRAMETLHAALDQLAWKIALFLETTGGRAVPVPADEPYRHWEPERAYGRGDLSHKHAAQAAGLGKLGKNSLLITPQFGNMVHFVSIITDIQLLPDPMLEWEPCPADCSICKDICPAGAIIENQKVEQELCRKILIKKLPKGMVIESCNACRRACAYGR